MDVDGSYTHRKYECLKEAGEQVLMPSNPPPPLTGWKKVTDANFKDIARSIPQVTSGKYYNLCFTFYIKYMYERRSCVYILGWTRWALWGRRGF